MCFTFLAAQGHSIGDACSRPTWSTRAGALLDEHGDRLVLPTDITALGPGGE